MDYKEFQKKLRDWLESNWSIENNKTDIITIKNRLPEELLRYTKECKKCESLLKSALLLMDGEVLKKSPTTDVYQKIYKALEDINKRKAIRINFIEKISLVIGLKDNFMKQKWAFISLTGLFILILLTMLTFSNISFRPKIGGNNLVTVHLYLKAPGASKVSVVGDWNGWDPNANQMHDQDGDGIWEIQINLKPGIEYQYQFVIDGKKRIPDPNDPIQIDNGFGGENSILQI